MRIARHRIVGRGVGVAHGLQDGVPACGHGRRLCSHTRGLHRGIDAFDHPIQALGLDLVGLGLELGDLGLLLGHRKLLGHLLHLLRHLCCRRLHFLLDLFLRFDEFPQVERLGLFFRELRPLDVRALLGLQGGAELRERLRLDFLGHQGRDARRLDLEVALDAVVAGKLHVPAVERADEGLRDALIPVGHQVFQVRIGLRHQHRQTRSRASRTLLRVVAVAVLRDAGRLVGVAIEDFEDRQMLLHVRAELQRAHGRELHVAADARPNLAGVAVGQVRVRGERGHIDLELGAGGFRSVVEQHANRRVDHLLVVAHDRRQPFAKDARLVFVEVVELIRPRLPFDGLQHGADDFTVRQQPDVCEEALMQPVVRHLHAAGAQLVAREVAPALIQVVLPGARGRHQRALVADLAQLVLVPEEPNEPVRVAVDVVADLVACEGLSLGQIRDVLARQAVTLPHEPAVLELGHAHVGIPVPDRHVRQERRRESLGGLHEAALLVVPLVGQARAMLDQRPLEDAGAVEVARVQDGARDLAILGLGQLIVDAVIHPARSLVGEVLHCALDRLRVGLLALIELRQHLDQLLFLRRRDARLGRGLDLIVALAVGREQQIGHARIDRLDLDPGLAQKSLAADDLFLDLRVVAPFVLAQVLQPAFLDFPALGLGAQELAHQILTEPEQRVVDGGSVAREDARCDLRVVGLRISHRGCL